MAGQRYSPRVAAHSEIATAGIPMPPEDLRQLTTGVRDAGQFLASGRQSRVDLDRALAAHGHAVADFESVLDFGVGVGRVARHLGDAQRLTGCDVMADMITWLRAEMPFGT
jgi:SAM-dependent methyltransferase